MKYQRLRLTLKDGRETYWAGPMQIAKGEPLEIIGGAVIEPVELPPDARLTDKAKIQTVKGVETETAKKAIEERKGK